MLLSPLTPDDIPEVMRLERLPGYDAFIGQWTAEQHAAEMASPDARYFGVREGGLAAFLFLQDVRAPQVRLRRISVRAPEQGLGGRMLREVTDRVFETTAAEGFWLDVHVHNPRAQRVYAREGLVSEGQYDETHLRMTLPRARWAELRGR
jgi:RimJ/RimL family protein N-acetyltransferase